uniref:Putative ovule protein n=1 Tax=Solanum chacoense TaxID=4108 RepID=A0A0V0GLU5_SOLCH
MLEVSSSKPLAGENMGFVFGSSSSHRACLVRVTSLVWFASYCIETEVLPCAHPKGSGCVFSLS